MTKNRAEARALGSHACGSVLAHADTVARPFSGVAAAVGTGDGEIGISAGWHAIFAQARGGASATAGVHGGQRLVLPNEDEPTSGFCCPESERVCERRLAEELAMRGVAEVVVAMATARVEKGARNDSLSLQTFDCSAGRALSGDD